MKKYELLAVLPGTLDDKEADAKSQEILSVVKAQGSEVELGPLGKNRLAYPIKQIRYGYFYTIIFSAEPENLKAIQNSLGLMRDVLRFMITYFNTQLTASQKIAYTTDAAGVTTMTPKEEPEVVRAVRPVIAPKVEKLNIEDLNKKLDEIMEGDVVPGV